MRQTSQRFFNFLLAACLLEPITAIASPSGNSAESASQSSMKIQIENKVFQDNRDLTDAKLRAEAGSLSRYSLKFNLTYFGPTLGDLTDKDQPNPDGSIGSYQTALSGGFGLRYRLSPQSTFGLSTGLKSVYPLHGAERVDMNNPSLTYDYSTRWNNIQLRNSPGFVLRTVPDFTRVGQTAMIYDNFSLVYDLGASGFSVGADLAAGYFIYNRDYRKGDGKAPHSSFEINPNLKYNFSDKISAQLSSNIAFWNPRTHDSRFTFLRKTVSQRAGIGYSIRRDVYINPYLTFYPETLSPSNVTLNVASVFSMF